MRFIVIAFVAAFAATPASAQQAGHQAPAAQVETGAAAVQAAPAVAPSAVAPAQRHMAGPEVVQPRFNDERVADTGSAAQVDPRTRNILAIIGAVVVVLALLAFIR
jgi:hypothetical protein